MNDTTKAVQLELELEDPIDDSMRDFELMSKMRDALADMYVMFMQPDDFTDNEKLDTLNLTRDALNEYTKAHG